MANIDLKTGVEPPAESCILNTPQIRDSAQRSCQSLLTISASKGELLLELYFARIPLKFGFLILLYKEL